MKQLIDAMLIIYDEKEKSYKLNPQFLSGVDVVLKKIEDETQQKME
jgi:hypothetical protein